MEHHSLEAQLKTQRIVANSDVSCETKGKEHVEKQKGKEKEEQSHPGVTHIGLIGYKRKRFQSCGQDVSNVSHEKEQVEKEQGEEKEEQSHPDTERKNQVDGTHDGTNQEKQKHNYGPIKFDAAKSHLAEFDELYVRPRSPPRLPDRCVRICKQLEGSSGASDDSDEEDQSLVVEKLHMIWLRSSNETLCKELLKKVGRARFNFLRLSSEGGFYAFLTEDETAKMRGLTSDGVFLSGVMTSCTKIEYI